ncbi:MAG: 2OG-Fe(II) oxygenase [Paralcaligenes sp.]
MSSHVSEPALDVPLSIDAADWSAAFCHLEAEGWAILPKLLRGAQCDAIRNIYGQSGVFRSRVIMSRHGFGRGEYQYFDYPLPGCVQTLRTYLYSHLTPIANRWHEALKNPIRFPASHAAFIERCHASGQVRPTPLLLQYGEGDYNCLHQDLYGDHVFPIQVAILLSNPNTDFEGGEFVLTEQRPRMQSRAMVAPMQKGDAVVFAVNNRPVSGSRGAYRVKLRHGVSKVRSGHRHTLGIIFHDAA